MNIHLKGYVAIACFFLSACGGGSTKTEITTPEVVTPPPPPPQLVTKVTLQISSTELRLSGAQGDAVPVTISGSWDATDLGANSVFIRAVDDNKKVLNTTVLDATATKNFTLNTLTNHSLQVGSHASTISLVACKDINCNNVYDNTSQSLNVQLTLTSVPEWQTHQANTAHNGYIPIIVATNNFKKLWEWSRPISAETLRGINGPVAGKGFVYFAHDVYFGDAQVVALDELTGAEAWKNNLGYMPALNSPAINQDTLFIATSGHLDTKLWALNRLDGKTKFNSPFLSQWGHYLAPTIDNNIVFQTGGTFGGVLTAFSTVNGETLWNHVGVTSWGMDAVATDEKNVYAHDGAKLSVLQKHDGALIATINDTFNDDSGYEYHGTPVLGSKNNVLAFSGRNLSGRASANAEHQSQRKISSFDLTKKETNWVSEFGYKTFFAVANGVIYAARNEPALLDAIDENTGKILWSWTPPSAADLRFHRNVIATQNLLFISTNANIYAIDLNTKKPVWSYPEPGMMTISDNRILFLATGSQESNGKLIAFDMRTK